MTNKPQIDRFRELARELETDDSPERFDEQLRRIAKPPPEKGDTPKKTKPGQ